MSDLGQFLDRPGLPGAFGALMDEYARAAAEFCAQLERTRPEDWTRVVPTSDPNVSSLRSLAAHVVGAAHRYADYIRERRGQPFVDRFVVEPAELGDALAVRPRLGRALRYTEAAVEGLNEATEQEISRLVFRVRWGPVYDPEMLLEHAIVHLLRHRRQVARWPEATA